MAVNMTKELSENQTEKFSSPHWHKNEDLQDTAMSHLGGNHTHTREGTLTLGKALSHSTKHRQK